MCGRITTNVSSTNGPIAALETKWFNLKNVLITGQNIITCTEWPSHKRRERVTKSLSFFCSISQAIAGIKLSSPWSSVFLNLL